MRTSNWRKGKKLIPAATFANTAALPSPLYWEVGSVESAEFELVLSASSATPSLVLTIQGWDPASGTYYTVLASAALAADGRKSLLISPNATAANNLIAQTLPPKKLKFVFSGTLGGGSAVVSLFGRAQ